jgi:hypothetical protein
MIPDPERAVDSCAEEERTTGPSMDEVELFVPSAKEERKN